MSVAIGNDGRIGRYRLVKRLAVGGMADIWLGQEFGPRGYDRTVVVKTIRSDLVEDEDLIPMLIEEARIARCLKHENIVELHEVGEENGTHFLSMEFVFGRDLRQIRDRCLELGARVPQHHIAAILSGVLDALYYAYHEATFEGRPLHVIHRDVSPQNIIVGFDGTVKLLDFGIAKAAAQLSRTRAGVLKGKYAYMSPEQVDFRELDQRADVFGAGIVLWEMLTEQRLFYRPSEYETVKAVVACEVPFARSVNGGVPWQLAWIAHRALRRNPRWRYRDARRMRAALHRWDPRPASVMRDGLAAWMGQIFGEELALREQALARARREPTRHRQIQDAGLELIDESLRPRRESSGPSEVGAQIAPRPRGPMGETPTEERPVGFFVRALTSWRWFLATLGVLVFLGVSCGVYWGTFYGGGGPEYAYVSVLAESSDVQVIIGDRNVGHAPVKNVVVLPGRHRIVGIAGDEREAVEIVVPAGQRETVRLSIPQNRH